MEARYDGAEATNTAGEGSIGMLDGPICRDQKNLPGCEAFTKLKS